MIAAELGADAFAEKPLPPAMALDAPALSELKTWPGDIFDARPWIIPEGPVVTETKLSVSFTVTSFR